MWKIGLEKATSASAAYLTMPAHCGTESPETLPDRLSAEPTGNYSCLTVARPQIRPLILKNHAQGLSNRYRCVSEFNLHSYMQIETTSP